MKSRRTGISNSQAAQQKPAAAAVPHDELWTLRPGVVWKAYRAEHFAFLAMCVYLFFEYVKPEQQYGIFGILPFLKLSLITAIIGFAVDKTSRFQPSAMHWFLFLFLIHCVITAMLAYRSDLAFAALELIYIPVIVFVLMTGIVNTEKRLFLFLLVYFVSNLRMSQFGFFSWVKRGFSFASYGVTGAGWFRNSGEFGMQMAMFFAYTVCFAFFLRHYWRGWMKWLIYFLPVSALGCVIASSSRGAIVGVVGALFYLSMFSKKKIRAWLGTVLLGYLVFLLMPPEFLARFQSAGSDQTSLSRIYYWGRAREIIEEHPFTGVGFYNWVPYFQDHYFDPKISHRVELAHNTFLQTGAEIGYPGLVLFSLMILMSFWINWRSERMCRQPGFEFLRSFALGMNAAGTALVVCSMFLTATYMPSFWIHFGLTVCLRLAIKHKRKDSQGLPARKRAQPRRAHESASVTPNAAQPLAPVTRTDRSG